MDIYKKFVLDELPKSAVVNSNVHANAREIEDLIINAVSEHLSSIVDFPEKLVDESLKEVSITDNKPVNDLIDIEAIKKEEYERGVIDTEARYNPLLASASS